MATVGSEYVNKIKKSMGKKEKGGGEDGTSGRDGGEDGTSGRDT